MEAVAGTESPLGSSRFDVAGFLATEMQGALDHSNPDHWARFQPRIETHDHELRSSSQNITPTTNRGTTNF